MSEASKPHSTQELVERIRLDLEFSPSDDGDKALTDLVEQLESAMDVLNYAWTIICNVSEGDWAMQPPKWQEAAARCRDQYHALLAAYPAAAPSEEPIPASEPEMTCEEERDALAELLDQAIDREKAREGNDGETGAA